MNPERPGRWPRHLRRLARFDEAGGTPSLDRGWRIEQRSTGSTWKKWWTVNVFSRTDWEGGLSMDAGYIAGGFGLIGAAIGSASSIAAMVIQARMKDKRDRSKQLTDMSLAEFKMHLDLATSGHGPTAILPPSAYMHHNDLLLKAIETGTYTPERAREISALSDKMFDVARDIDKQRQKGSGA